MVKRLYDERDAIIKELVSRLMEELKGVSAVEGVVHRVEKPGTGREVTLRGTYVSGQAEEGDDTPLGFINL